MACSLCFPSAFLHRRVVSATSPSTGRRNLISCKSGAYATSFAPSSSFLSVRRTPTTPTTPTTRTGTNYNSFARVTQRNFASSMIEHPSGININAAGQGLGLDMPPSRAPLFQESPLSSFANRYYYLFSAMGVFGTKSRQGQHSENLYRSIEEQATQEEWWERLKLPRTWITEQSLLALHVWILHNRLKIDYNLKGEFSGRRMQEELFEKFWEDATLRIRNAGIVEVSVNKQLEGVQKAAFDDMFTYDEAIKVEGDDGMEFAAAVWKGIWREAEDADTEAVLKLADYVRREVFSVLLQPKEDVYRGWITWGPIVGESEADRIARQKRMLVGEWREAIAPTGKVFFYHTSTHERRWDPPPVGEDGQSGLYPRRRFALRAYLVEHPEARALVEASDGGITKKALEGNNGTDGNSKSNTDVAGAITGSIKTGDEAISSSSSAATPAKTAKEIFGNSKAK